MNILAFEDCEADTELLAMVIDELGHDVEFAQSSDVCSGDIQGADVCITDVNMPMCDGFGVISELSSRFPEMKFILMSGVSAEMQAHYYNRSHVPNVHSYIIKPITALNLAEALKGVENAS